MAIHGLSGSLLSLDALARTIPAALGRDLDEGAALRVGPRLRAWHQRVREEMGPASSARAVFDKIAWPLFRELGFDATVTAAESGGSVRASLSAGPAPVAALVVTPWGHDPGAAWREAVLHGIGAGARWCFCVTGPLLRVIDAERTYSRRFIQFDLDAVVDADGSVAVLWGLCRADAFRREPPVLDRAVALSEQHRAEVRASLQEGVHEALTELVGAFSSASRRRRPGARDNALFDESLVVVYRILFLLFAEARGLVPSWHPVYRDNYTIDSLRPMIERGGAPHGLWESLQAIARLAHRGCRAGTLRVPPFNGRLFSPAHAPLAESAALDEGAVGRALLALTTRVTGGKGGRGSSGGPGRQRVAYADLGVEQLGGVYERVLDFQPGRTSTGGITLVHAERRKATGSFYTPRTLTEYLVRRTLAPLVHGVEPEAVLSLRVLDPAMGSGAFLVAACRFLAAAYEQALVRTGIVSTSDVTETERASVRRTIAQRCLFGVDVNPMAVQLGRLSLWLATLAGDRPLTFLDHHLRAGNSLAGAALADVARPPGPAPRGNGHVSLPLFEQDEAGAALRAMVMPRTLIAEQPGDTIDQVRAKERALAGLGGTDGPLARWRTIADLWCASWFGAGSAAKRGVFQALTDEILGRAVALPGHVSRPLLGQAREIAGRERFFHWTLEFPEIFFTAAGEPLARPGFDAVIGNPPWEMLRGDRGDDRARRSAAESSAQLTAFARASGVYRLQGDGHANLYQLFLERALGLVCNGGRIGMVLPSGFASDHGCSRLRRHALDRTRIDTFVCVENRDGLFPIHRGLKFLLLAATHAAGTPSIPCRFGVRSPATLDRLPDEGIDDGVVRVTRRLLADVSGEEQLAIPELRTPADLAIVSKLSRGVPALADPGGWNVRFGRELNASDDKPSLVEGAGQPPLLPVLEGKQVRPFAVDCRAARFHIDPAVAARLLPSRPFERPRLAYRDVAASTNRLTLIAAIVPAGVVTTHTLFCVKGAVDEEVQRFLCGMLNSYVANYLVRIRVGTHVTVAIVERLPVPVPSRDSAEFIEVSELAGSLAAGPAGRTGHARLQALAAGLYGLTPGEFRHVLSTFPLVEEDERAAAAAAFDTRADAI